MTDSPAIEIRYHFRGVWCPVCRVQIAQLIQAAPDLRSEGISIHLVTAQPKSVSELRQMFSNRGITVPDFIRLSSDPDHKLLVQDTGDIYTIKPTTFDGHMYMMVQPAVVVIDLQTGNSIKECAWSWKLMFSENVYTLGDGQVRRTQLDELYQPIPGVKLVTYRPVISDLQSAIREKRMVKVAVAMPTNEMLLIFLFEETPLKYFKAAGWIATRTTCWAGQTVASAYAMPSIMNTYAMPSIMNTENGCCAVDTRSARVCTH